MQSGIDEAGNDMTRLIYTCLLSISILGILTSLAGPIFSPFGWLGAMPDEVLPHYLLAPLAILIGLVIRRGLIVLLIVPPFVALWIYLGFTKSWWPSLTDSLTESSLLGFLSATLLLSLTINRGKNCYFHFSALSFLLSV